MKVRLAIILLFIPALLAADSLRLGEDVVPRAQGVSLTADPRMDSFSGSVVVELDVRKSVSTFRFHAEDLKITSVKVNGADAKFADGPENMIDVTLPAPLKIGRATMTADFTGPFNRQAVGFYKMLKDGDPYLFTQFEAIDARRAFPSWDEPGFKIPYQLTLTIPSKFDAVSNTPIQSETPNGEWKTVRFAPTKPLPSYLIAFAVGTFDYVPIEGMSVPGRVVTPKGQARLAQLAARVTPPILALLEKYFDAKYPFEKVDLLAVPEYWAGAMENPGAITYRDTVLLVDPVGATPAQKRNLIRITAHELAHMWFGDLVTMEWWDDLWLNESFADWMGDKITEQYAPELGHEVAELQDIQALMNSDVRPSAPAIRLTNADPMQSLRNVGVAYNKGKAVLSMIEQWIGEGRFREGVLDHLRMNAWGNATATDFWNALSRHAPKEVTAALASFVEQPGIPIVTVEPLENGRIRLSQRRLVTGKGATPEVWQIPITMRYESRGATKIATFLLDKQTKIVEVPRTPAWVFPTANGIGYYRWTIPASQMTALAAAAPQWLTVKERVSFVGNAAALFRAGEMRGDTYLDVLTRFANDREAPVVNSVVGQLSHLRSTFDVPQTSDAFSAYIRKLLRPALDRIGMQPRPNEAETVTQLRPQLITWLADEGNDAEVRAFAREQAAKYAADSKSVDGSIAAAVLAISAIDGDAALFDEYKRHFETATVPAERSRYLAALSSFRKPELRARAREFALTNARVQEIFGFLGASSDATDAERQEVFDWMTANYDRVATRMPRGFSGGIASIAGGCDEKRLEATRKFFADEKRKSEATERVLNRTAESVKECVALRNREMSSVATYLQKR